MADTSPTHRHATTHGHPRHEAHNDHEPGRTVPITHAHAHRSQRQLTCQNRHMSSRDLPRPPECTPEPPPTPGKHRGRCPVQLSPLSKYGKCMEQPPRRPGSTPVPPQASPVSAASPNFDPDQLPNMVTGPPALPTPPKNAQVLDTSLDTSLV